MHSLIDNPIVWEDMEHIEKRGADWDWLIGKKIMITGAYGMLASYCVFFLIYLNEVHPDYNIKIIAQGRKQSKMRERFGKYTDKSYFWEMYDDICKPVKTDYDIDYIIHAASMASPQYYKDYPVDVLTPNSLGTYYLLQLAKEKQADGFLFFSSGEIYGNVGDIKSVIEEADAGYLDSMNIRSCYGESKRMGENMCVSFAQQYKVPAKCVRIYHTYGPTMDLEHDQRVFAEFTSNVVSGKDILIKSDGSSMRSFCYLSDAVDAFFRILKDETYGIAYNMCNKNGQISMEELAIVLAGLHPDKQLKAMFKTRGDSSYLESFVKRAVKVSTERLENLGWVPVYDVTSGFQRTIESYLVEKRR